VRLFVLALTLALSAGVFAAPDEDKLGKAQGYPACPNARGSISAEHCLIWVMSHYPEIYPSRAVKAAAQARPLERGGPEPKLVQPFLDANRNTGLMVLKGDSVLSERYQYERKPEHLMASMSMAKTFIGMLIGIALDEGKIASIDDRVERYVPALKGHAYGETPIRALLTMSSGVKFDEIYSGDSDMIRFATAVLFQQGPGGADALRPYNQRVAAPGTRFSYSSAETFVLALVLRGATGRNVSEYMSEKLWQPMGAENDAAWNIDPAGNEVGYCCFSATLRDFARFGLLLADGGAWKGRQIIPAAWLREATAPSALNKAYGYQTWTAQEENRFALRGVRGQAIDVHPASRTVVVHTAVYPFAPGGRDNQVKFFNAVLRDINN
jgi:CubicO group peptidase (beta-lactamase class C family)